MKLDDKNNELSGTARSTADAQQQNATTTWSIPGMGLLKGLAVTGKNFVQSYYKKERMTTVQYPEEKAEISPNFRNFPFLVYDGDEPTPGEGLRCTSCKICEKSCPPQCIYIVLKKDEKGKSAKCPETFEIDLSVCMNCGICAEVCPFESIFMDGEYEMSSTDRFGGLLFGLDKLAKPVKYHEKIRPLEAAKIAAQRKAAAEKKAKAEAAKAARLKAKAEAALKAKAEAEGEGDSEKGENV